MQNLFWLGGSIVLSYGLYRGYYFGKSKVYEMVMSYVTKELDKRLENEEECFKPIHSNSAIIKVKHGGKIHSVYVPYDRRKSSRMLSKKVFLIQKGEKIEITQKPGIPYMVTASTLGGEEIIVEDLSGEIIKRFSEDEIPNYL